MASVAQAAPVGANGRSHAGRVPLGRVRVGDIVLVDDGLPYMAEVLERPPGTRSLRVQQIGRRATAAPRTVKSRWIAALWRRVV